MFTVKIDLYIVFYVAFLSFWGIFIRFIHFWKKIIHFSQKSSIFIALIIRSGWHIIHTEIPLWQLWQSCQVSSFADDSSIFTIFHPFHPFFYSNHPFHPFWFLNHPFLIFFILFFQILFQSKFLFYSFNPMTFLAEYRKKEYLRGTTSTYRQSPAWILKTS